MVENVNKEEARAYIRGQMLDVARIIKEQKKHIADHESNVAQVPPEEKSEYEATLDILKTELEKAQQDYEFLKKALERT